MARIPQAWPEEVNGLIQFVYSELDHLKKVFSVCQREGIERPDYVLVTRLLPTIREIIGQIDMAMLEADELLPEAGPGQVPTWRKSHDFLLHSAVNLADCYDKFSYHVKHKKWSTASKLINACVREIDEMREAIEQAPFRSNDTDQGITLSLERGFQIAEQDADND